MIIKCPSDLPALHPGFCTYLALLLGCTQTLFAAIPTVHNGGNHTPAFAEAARTIQAHEVMLNVSKALAGVGIRVLADEDFVKKVRVDVNSYL